MSDSQKEKQFIAPYYYVCFVCELQRENNVRKLTRNTFSTLMSCIFFLTYNILFPLCLIMTPTGGNPYKTLDS